jgi:F-type H+-transporting ATPase subunit delta
MEELAQVYANALFEVASEHEVIDDVREQLGQFADELDGNRDLQLFLFSPYFSSQEKKDGIGKIIDGADERFLNFLELLAERHRMPAIFRIRRA